MYVCTRCNKKSEHFAQMSPYASKACYACGGSVYYVAKEFKQEVKTNEDGKRKQ